MARPHVSPDVFGAVSHAIRRRILDQLARKSMTVGEIAQHFTCSNATLTFHLRILRHAGLVQSTRKGRYLTYTIITRKLERIHNWISRYEFSGR